MAETPRAVEAELAEAAIAAANSPVGLIQLIQLLLQAPSIVDSPDGQAFIAQLSRYVRLKRQRARWYSGGYLGGYRSETRVPGLEEIGGAREAKNYFLARLVNQFGRDKALELQRKLGNQISDRGYEYSTQTRGE